MSDDPRLRWGFAHEQTPRTSTFYYRNRFKRRQQARRLSEPAGGVPTVAQLAAADNLIDTFDEMRSRAGQAPGPDGISYADLSPMEVGNIFREVSRAVIEGSYRPGPARVMSIIKLSGGHRTLRLSNLIDRVVAAALNKALTPFWEKIFLPTSMGFRPGRSVWRLLAELEQLMAREGRWVLALDDIKDAFPSVAIADVLADHARYLEDPSLLALIAVVLRGSDGNRVKGIDQGSPYSPTALNARLHHAHDLGVQGHHPPGYRYADNLIYLCRSVSEGHHVLSHVRQLLEPAGFTLKGEDGIKDLQRGEQVQLLGHSLSFNNGRLRLGLGHKAWVKLEQNLVLALQTSVPAIMANMVIAGWIDAYGAAFENWRATTLNRILHTASQTGFRETFTREDLAERCETAWRRWDRFRKGIVLEPIAVSAESR